jgi:hypothetical protein
MKASAQSIDAVAQNSDEFGELAADNETGHEPRI